MRTFVLTFCVVLLCMCLTLWFSDDGVNEAAAKTLPLRCVVPMATNTKADDTLMVFKGGANCRITPGPPTQHFRGARCLLFLNFFVSSCCAYVQPFGCSYQSRVPIILPAARVGCPYMDDTSRVPVILPVGRVGYPYTTHRKSTRKSRSDFHKLNQKVLWHFPWEMVYLKCTT